MQLKNNGNGNIQFHYSVTKNGLPDVDYIHIPGGATVEIEDEIFAQLCGSQSTGQEMEEIDSPIENDAAVLMDKKQVRVVEYIATGRTRPINLVKAMIKEGYLTIVSRPRMSMEDIDKKLEAAGIPTKDMSDEAKLALVDKLV